MKTFVSSLFLTSLLVASNSFAMQIIGHRGACGYAPENTLTSFQIALDLGVDMIALDVHKCATGELVVIHDETVDRTTNGSGRVADMSFDHLRSLTIGEFEQIPTLQEVIDLVDGQVTINIQLTGAHTAEPVAELLNFYFELGWTPDDFVISSFHHDRVALFQLFCPDVCTGLLFQSAVYENFIETALFFNVQFIGFSYKLFVPEVIVPSDFIDCAHDNGLQLFVFTINGAQTAGMLADLGIDGIYSDYPDQVQ